MKFGALKAQPILLTATMPYIGGAVAQFVLLHFNPAAPAAPNPIPISQAGKGWAEFFIQPPLMAPWLTDNVMLLEVIMPVAISGAAEVFVQAKQNGAEQPNLEPAFGKDPRWLAEIPAGGLNTVTSFVLHLT